MSRITFFHLSILGFLAACFFLQGTEARSCPQDWINFERYCYSLKKIARNWNDAEADCQTYGEKSHLASILSEEENKRVAAVIAGGNDPGYRIWIGLFRKKKGGKNVQLRWSDTANFDYAAWGEGQPDKSGYCVEIFGEDYDMWNDTDCDDENYYLCKIPL
ncbi:C-type lectin lectoxin-Lei1-like [Podarcis raffonei]|uniref:C-type lectin lectoxin-Lei1-like n=1 Tax=Podarcis raffonei TaxID=65483 RepID=UPI002329118D|nr:C-type lectin lectoxin-Lei1-like [Podarcis raffonei]